MCGLSGVLLSQPLARPELHARLQTMIGALRHRGPDDQGVWLDGAIGLAHARLAVIDLSAAGHQPIRDDDERIALVANGEIYNFQTLRAELEQKGHRFRSRTDSEVILHGYKEWREGVFARLRGMFAVAIWDADARRLVLARDRIGKKPLFYAETAAGLIFASEIKAILAWPGVRRAADLAAVHDYLSLQYVPAPHTAFLGITSLQPAHWLRVDVGADGRPGRLTTSRYWSFPEPVRSAPAAPAALAEELVGRLEESVRLRMVADVPIGVFLSGGLDSSAVLAMMARAGAGRIRTFTIGFDQPAYDESVHARQVAAHFGTEHHEFIVKPDAGRVLPALVWHFDQPFADPSAVPTFHLAELARRHVTVALSGDGGDECFMGYGRYARMRHLARLDRLPRWMTQSAAWALDEVPAPRRFARRRASLVRILRESRQPPSPRYGALIANFHDEMKQEGYAAGLRAYAGECSVQRFTPYFSQAPDLASGARWADLHMYLPGNLMVKVDTATMAHGLECRSPLLDHELMSWAGGLDTGAQMAGGVTKRVLKHAMASYLPQRIVHRTKMGFGCPVDTWLRTDLKEMAGDLLRSPTFTQRELFEPAYVSRLLDTHTSGSEDHGTRLWALLMLELWFRMWIDRSDVPMRG